MEVPFFEFRNVFPCVAAKLGFPIGGRGVGFTVYEVIVIHILFVACQRFLEPLVFGRGVVKHHIEHQAYSAFVGFGYELFQILHGAEDRVYISVIRNVVAVIV